MDLNSVISLLRAPRQGDVAPDPNYWNVAKGFTQKYPDLHYATQDVENRTNNPHDKGLEPWDPAKNPAPPTPSEELNPLSAQLGAKNLDDWPVNWLTRWGARFDAPNTLDHQISLIRKMNTPMERYADVLRRERHLPMPSFSPRR